MFGLVGVAAATYGLRQDAENQKMSLQQEQEHHDRVMQALEEQHREEITTAKQTHLIHALTNIEQFCQELNENLVDSTRDAERDMVDQRNQQYSTVLLSVTIMLSALITVLIEGTLPKAATSELKILYSLSNSGSIVFVALSMLLCIQITFRATSYMYKRSRWNLQYLSEALTESESAMQVLRGDDTHERQFGNIAGEQSVRDLQALGEDAAVAGAEGRDLEAGEENTQNLRTLRSFSNVQFMTSDGDSASSSPNYGFRTRSDMPRSPEEDAAGELDVPISRTEEQWRMHERKLHSFLQKRSAISERRELAKTGLPFEKYWLKHCKSMGDAATFSFYAGTTLMLAATTFHLWAVFIYTYKSNVAAIVSATTIGLSLLVSISLALYLRFFNETIIDLRAQFLKEMNDDDNRTVTSAGESKVD